MLLVPLRAVRTSGGRRVVEVLKDGQPVQQEVQLGLTNDQFAEVASGLSEGEQVIVSTQQSGQSQQQAPGPGGAIPRGFFR
ncbi:MAG: hypothetical protein HYY31_06915 [Chloroflexi bacterium]|nr:hypothetical protein [Chloroflexota bacterium]